jgi:DNA-binding LacI/PurR family transcriptional regulator
MADDESGTRIDGPAPTLVDVARLAGVSRATVSRVVNCVPSVGPELRHRVQRAIAEVGYVSNTAAASLVTRRHRQVALIVSGGYAENDAILGRTVRRVTAQLTEARMTCVVNVVLPDEELSGVARRIRTAGVDAAIVVADRPPHPLSALLDAAGVLTATVSTDATRPDGRVVDRALWAHTESMLARITSPTGRPELAVRS